MQSRVAVVERLKGHTEIMGGFAALGQLFGYETHLFYTPADNFQMADYFRSKLPDTIRSVQTWTDILSQWRDFDVIVLTTSDVWANEANLLEKWSAERRLIVVHHRPDYVSLLPTIDRYVALTPALGPTRWLLPMYCMPSTAPERRASLRGVDQAALPCLVTIGSLKTKDSSDVARYLRVGGRVVHYGRDRYEQLEVFAQHFRQFTALSSSNLIQSLKLQEQPIMLWIPVVPDSEYTSLRFTGALLIGIYLDCVMVMPEKLRDLYQFPSGAIITYKQSILEEDTLEALLGSARKQAERLALLFYWKMARWDQNARVFNAMIG